MELQLVVFTLAGEDFGVPIEQVREINRLVQIMAIPQAPRSVLGVINLRGKIIPVISLRERFGFDRGQNSEATRIVVSDVAGQTAGFVVDAVTEVLRLDERAMEAAPQTTVGVDSAFIRGIGKVDDRLIIILDLERVFDFSSLQGLSA
ncbi:MAG: chemotaxis protein CheW [Chitinophagales bacterium]